MKSLKVKQRECNCSICNKRQHSATCKKLVHADVLVYGVTVQNKTLEDEFLAITGGVKA